MTDFQIGLAIMGAVAVAGVLLYNRLQERSARRKAEKHFVAHHPDALMESMGPRREPTLAGTAHAALQEEPQRTDSPARRAAHAALPDERIDYVIDVSFPAPVQAAAWLEPWRSVERRFRQKVLLVASNDGRNWEPPIAGHAWSRYRAGLQLVSRSGMVGEGDVLEFRSSLEGITASLSGVVEPTDAREAIDRAHKLDALCADFDIQVAFHLVAPENAAFPPDAVRRNVVEAGMEEDEAGFLMRDALGLELFGLSAGNGSGQVNRLTFSLDVPRSDDLRRAYRSMIATAQNLSAALGGTLVDDNGTALEERALEAIWRSVEPVSQSLEKNGLAPGSPLALRLFS